MVRAFQQFDSLILSRFGVPDFGFTTSYCPTAFGEALACLAVLPVVVLGGREKEQESGCARLFLIILFYTLLNVVATLSGWPICNLANF